MHDFKKRHGTARHILRFLATVAGAMLLLVLAVVAIKAAWGMYGTFRTAAEARDSALSELAILRADEGRVMAAVAALETPQGVEQEVRERYGVAKPGEGEIHIVRDTSAADAETPTQSSFFEWLFHSLFAW